MKVKNTLIAFAILLVLGGAFYLLNRQPEKPRPSDIPREKIFSFAPEQVQEFTVQVSPGEPATFRRIADAPPAPAEGADSHSADGQQSGAQWEVVSPEGVPANHSEINSYLEQLLALEGTTLSDVVAPNWSDYGLDPPATLVQFTLKDGSTHEFAVGAENPHETQYYVRRETTGPLMLMAAFGNENLLKKNLLDFRDKRILPVSFNQVQRIVLHFRIDGRPSRLVLTKQPDDNWTLDEPRRRTDYGTSYSLFSTLQYGEMMSVAEEKPSSLARYALDDRALRVELTTPDGVHSLLIGRRADDDGHPVQSFYAKNSIWPTVFTIPRSVYEQVSQHPENYRNRFLFDFQSYNASGVEIEGPSGPLRFEFRNGSWVNAAAPPDRETTGELKIQDFLNKVRNLRIIRYTSDAPGQFPAYGLDRPWLRVRVAFGDGDNKREETVIFSKFNNRFYAAREGEASVYEMQPDEPDSLEAQLKELAS